MSRTGALSIASDELRHVANSRVRSGVPWPAELEEILRTADMRVAAEEIAQWPGYRPTPLFDLTGAASAVNVARVLYKDESERFGLGSFKALGGAYALWKLVERMILKQAPSAPARFRDVLNGQWSQVTRDITVATATDGNHGRSVAWGASLMGCRSVIFIHADVSEGREAALRKLGAEVVRVTGNYDDSVRIARETADREGWLIVSDTSYPGYTQVPRDVMAGYAVLMEETFAALPSDARLSHVFVQGGVGGLAASITASLWQRLGASRPRIIIVEPLTAACLMESARAGRPAIVHGRLDTAMAGLAAGEPSLLAWPVLELGAADFLAIPDEAALEVMRLLANGELAGQSIVAGESGTAGLAALLGTYDRPDLAQALGLSTDSVVLCIGTEGATDPQIYSHIVGRSASDVLAAGKR